MTVTGLKKTTTLALSGTDSQFKFKQELVEKHSLLRGYSDYICTLNSVSSDLHMNPFYLKPVNLNLKSNEVVRDLVKKNPQFYNNLSPIRKQSISLGPKQSIELSQKEPLKFEDAEKLAISAPDSKPRRLPVQVTINVDSIEEEAEILSIENLPFGHYGKSAIAGMAAKNT